MEALLISNFANKLDLKPFRLFVTDCVLFMFTKTLWTAEELIKNYQSKPLCFLTSETLITERDSCTAH